MGIFERAGESERRVGRKEKPRREEGKQAVDYQGQALLHSGGNCEPACCCADLCVSRCAAHCVCVRVCVCTCVLISKQHYQESRDIP